MPFSRAAWRMVVPSLTAKARPLIVMFTICPSSLPGIGCIRSGRSAGSGEHSCPASSSVRQASISSKSSFRSSARRSRIFTRPQAGLPWVWAGGTSAPEVISVWNPK